MIIQFYKLRKASCSNPHPNFQNCMQNDVMLVSRSLLSFCKKSNCILLFHFGKKTKLVNFHSWSEDYKILRHKNIEKDKGVCDLPTQMFCSRLGIGNLKEM